MTISYTLGQGVTSVSKSTVEVESFWRDLGYTNPPWLYANGYVYLNTSAGQPSYTISYNYLNTVKLITDSDSKSINTYLDIFWDMERVWTIVDGRETPRLIYRPVNLDLGTPSTHQMRYQHVVPDVTGTMNFMGITWKSKGSFYRFPDPPSPGTIGQVVEYEVGNLEHTIFDPEQNKNILVEFLASGIRDILGAGGFSQYNTELKRSVTVTNEASAQVNFYFVESRFLPSANYKISISTPEGIVDIMGKSDITSYPIRMQYEGIALGIPTVPINSSTATNIHVSTDNGIEALQIYEEFTFIL